ncbi:nucleotidyltransferase domain-containing protein [bacterium]|nr:nucleotidyltransferase domain-containing protein [bacterium]MBR4530920.1 nucleotidyltransferase domain-containing protein [bacterium]
MAKEKMSVQEIMSTVKPLADRYKIKEVYLFGSYARDEADSESDIDLLVYGGEGFKLTRVFAFAEELRELLDKKVDVFEIHEVNEDSDFYKNIMKDRILVA